jgi:hypothetical protein
MFELSRLIARESEFARNPANPKRGRDFFRTLHREKNAEPRICQNRPSFGYFSWRSKKSDSPLGEIARYLSEKSRLQGIPGISFPVRNTCGAK